ncbi:MAG TPA: hypothetical protein VFB07_12465 [Vicinamibacterales bacterium]|nr:hypothetical protein [Vicinamibacterales bacterium]
MPFLFAALRRAGGFIHIVDTEAEARKVAGLRIVVGLLLMWRTGIVARDAAYYFDPTPILGRPVPLEAVAGWIQCAVAGGLVVGVVPRACLALLMLTHAAFSIWTDTYNLGPMLLVPILGALLVLDSGKLTVHRRVRQTPSADEFRAAYLILFLAYAGWSLQAALYHVRDPYWIQGRTTQVMFLNSYLSEYYVVFRAWERASPATLRALSVFVGSAQILFQMAMIPLVFTRRGAAFVRTWGWIFILGSVVDLQLTLLPFVEAVLWAMVFFRARPSPAIDPAKRISTGDSIRRSGMRPAVAIYGVGYGFLSLMFFTNAILGFAAGASLPRWVANPVLYYVGLVAPNVFNTMDLQMGDRWAVLTHADGGQSTVVPLDGYEGQRLDYLRSDLLYFANSLRWRREMIFAPDLAAFHRPGARGYAFAYRVALYDHRRRRIIAPETYRVRIFHNYAAEGNRDAMPLRYAPLEVLEFTLTIGPHSTASSAGLVAEHKQPSA